MHFIVIVAFTIKVSLQTKNSVFIFISISFQLIWFLLNYQNVSPTIGKVTQDDQEVKQAPSFVEYPSIFYFHISRK
jgi:hypothetical protein